MSIKDRKFIDVLNQNDNVVVVGGMNGRGHVFEPGSKDSPSIVPMTIEEISYINTHCDAFKDGILRFKDEDQNEMYEHMGIKIENLLFNEWIEDAIRNPTTEKLNRILNVSKSSQFERIRGYYYSMMNAGEDLSVKVGRLIDARYNEIRMGKLHTAIVVTNGDSERPRDVSADVAELKKQVDEQKKIIEKYQAMMDAMMAGSEPAAASNRAEAEHVKHTRASKKKPVAESNT